MAQQGVTVELIRDGQCTPWGFRLTGGVDVGSPLAVQRVFLGSPSEGELKRGDVISKIKDVDATKLTHKQASDLITKAGNNLKLIVQRIPGFTPASPPVSPVPTLLNPGAPVTVYHLTSSTTTSSFPMYTSPPGSEHLFKPLPTTQFPQTPAARSAAMAYQSENEANKEKAAIITQPFRSVPLILPGVKATKDLPTGSYLRFATDTSGRAHQLSSAVPRRVNEAYMLSKVQEAVQEAASLSPRASVCSGRTPTPESYGVANGPQVYLRQYNSPINMYSNQAIRETIAAQTAMATKEHDEAGRTVSPRPPSDISKSPTYQLIHEEEWKHLDRKSLKEQPPVQERVHNVIPRDDAFASQQKIHQSGSFRTLMTSMQGLTEF